MLDIALQLARGDFVLDAAFKTPDRGVTALFGRSGAGKSTVINAIAGLVRPRSGHVRIGEDTFFDSARGIDMPIEQRRTGYVFQDSRLFPHMRVRDNLVYGFRRRRGEVRQIKPDTVTRLLGLDALLDRRPHTLSGGERQRVAIGRALLAQPRLLLLDEPMASLDGARKAEVFPYLERLRDEMRLPIVYVSHALDEVVRLADNMVLIDRGRVVAAGPTASIMGRLDLRPLTGRYEAGAILDTQVVRHDRAFGLSTLSFQGGELRIPCRDLPIGARVRVRIRSRDVMLALSPPQDVSVQNILPAVVMEIIEDGPFAEVRLGLQGAALLARITRHSSVRLGLRPGLALYAMIKSIAIDGRSMAAGVVDRDTAQTTAARAEGSSSAAF